MKNIFSKLRLMFFYLLGKKRQVVAGLIERDGKFLIAKRKAGSSLGGKWEFPGGKLEVNETMEECLRRELKEEFDIETEIGAFFCSVKFKYLGVPLELLVYRARYVAGGFTLTEHDGIAWVGKDEFAKYDFVEADRDIIARLG